MPNNPTKTKEETNYRMAAPGSKIRCDRCTMFRAPHACTLVKGPISPAGKCKEFDPK